MKSIKVKLGGITGAEMRSYYAAKKERCAAARAVPEVLAALQTLADAGLQSSDVLTLFDETKRSAK